MTRFGYALSTLLLLCPLALSRHDDDFAFDYSEEFQVELTANHSEIAKNGLKKLWGVPDTSAYAGHLFRMEIPKEAFSGEVLHYKVRNEDGRRTPNWLAVDSRHGLISGVPMVQDIGVHTFTVTAQGRTAGLTATDTFSVEVKKAEEKPHSKYGTCNLYENRLILVVLVDTPFHQTAPRQRIRALMELAKFMALDGDEFWIEPYKAEINREQSVLMSGPGTSLRRRGDGATAIYLNVGCGEKLWTRHKVLVAGLREQAKDGTLTHVLKLPVLGWRLTSVKPIPRPKRQLTDDDGSGDYDDVDDDVEGDYSGYDDDEEPHFDYGAPSEPVVPLTPAPPAVPHPRRHHHGDLPPPTPPAAAPGTTPPDTTFQTEAELTDTPPPAPTTSPPPPPAPTTPPPPPPETTTSSATSPSSRSPPEPTTEELPIVAPAFDDPPPTPEPATSTNTIVTEDHKSVKIEPYGESASEKIFHKVPVNPRIGHSPVMIVPETDAPPTTESQTVIIRASNEVPTTATPPTRAPTSPAPTTPTPAPAPSPSAASASAGTPPPTTPEPSPSATPTTPAPPPPTVASPPTTPPILLPVTPTAPTTPTTPSTTPVPETTIPDATPQETMTSTERTSTIIGRTTETVIFTMPNQPPTLQHHMKKLAITAGKAFRYIIPANLFTDPEGSNLTFSMYEGDNIPLSRDSWIQFMPAEREVYGLPLETHVSKWQFTVEARDSLGEVARAPLDITVQQHKARRTVNHEFVMQFNPNQPYQYAIDWQIRALEGIVNLFRDTDMHHLTVLNVTMSGDLYEFVWTNDTLPKETCPIANINRLMQIMESGRAGARGAASAALARAMAPALRVAGVAWRGAGACAAAAAGPRAPDTYPPVPRNQVDLLTATAGHLLRYRVPEDTFFDPEDGGTRNLKLSLRFGDRSEIPETHWLQFDSRNQEFYGLPTAADEAQMSYQLVAEDSSNKSAYDSLIVEVVKAPAIKPTVEFHMTMEYPYSMIANNAHTKQKIVEKLAALFDQKDTDSIRIQSITSDPTTVIWYNTSLPMDRCPKKEIEDLRRMIIVDERGSGGGALKEKVDVIFDKDFKVMSIRLVPLGLCAEQHTKTPRIMGAPIVPESKSQNTKSVSADGYTEYLVTFVIPAVVIVCMILVAGIIACVLYRRRRTGKMSVGDEEERQAFRSKGIPVIFQDELEERADAEPVHKSPVIMREEKPPLLPPAPDYRAGADDAPYRPPPPFAAAHSPPRPKATPSYRKPPPYVPP